MGGIPLTIITLDSCHGSDHHDGDDHDDGRDALTKAIVTPSMVPTMMMTNMTGAA